MENIDLSLEISRLLHYGLQQGLLEKEDLFYSANRMLALLGAREFTPQPVERSSPTRRSPWSGSATGPHSRACWTRTPGTPGTSWTRK